MKILRRLFFLVIIGIFTILLILSKINIAVFIAITTVWLLIFIFFELGPETIKEITLWKTSIKRDVVALKESRDEIEKIDNELKEMAKLIMENSYIIADASFLTIIGKDNPALKRLEMNLDKLSNIVTSNKEDKDLGWKSLKNEIYQEKKEKSD